LAILLVTAVGGSLLVNSLTSEPTRTEALALVSQARAGLASTELSISETQDILINAVTTGQTLSSRASSLAAEAKGVLPNGDLKGLADSAISLSAVVESLAAKNWIDPMSGARTEFWRPVETIAVPPARSEATAAELDSYADVVAGRDADSNERLEADVAGVTALEVGTDQTAISVSSLAATVASSWHSINEGSPVAAQSAKRDASRAANKVKGAADQISAITDYVTLARVVQASQIEVETLRSTAKTEAKAAAEAKAKAAEEAALAEEQRLADEAEEQRLADEAEEQRLADEAAAIEAERAAQEPDPMPTPTPSPTPRPTSTPTPEPTSGTASPTPTTTPSPTD
jgi:fused signal recognition particle receptor